MAKGVIYCMSSSIPGVIKIGKTETAQYCKRMKKLEDDGYKNMTGFKREFAIEVKDYDKKERLIHEIFSKSRIGDTECFAVNLNLVTELLASLDGNLIYPSSSSKDVIFDNVIHKKSKIQRATRVKQKNQNNYENIPDGKYYMERKIKDFGTVKGILKVRNGKFIVLRGSVCAPYRRQDEKPTCYKQAIFSNNVLQNDVECNSPSLAGLIVIGQAVNGWVEWKNENNQPLDIFRNKSN